MRFIRDITMSVLGLRACGGFTQMNLNKLRVLFHWNHIFFFLESHSCTVCHFLPFWWEYLASTLNALLYSQDPSTTCTALFPVNKLIFSYITCKELRGLTMLLLLSCWIIAGKIQYKLLICMFYEFQNQFIILCNHITLPMLSRKRSKWIIFFSIHPCLWHISKDNCIHSIAECNM